MAVGDREEGDLGREEAVVSREVKQRHPKQREPQCLSRVPAVL